LGLKSFKGDEEMRHDLLADAMSSITNAVIVGKNECVVKPVSKLVIKVLELFKREGYIDDYEIISEKRGGSIRVVLNGRMNKCMAVKPRFSTKKDEIEKYEKRYLPAKGFGCLIISTSKGLVTNQEIKDMSSGGKLIAYVY
jgi:small subunit ribosomal protein S8